MPYTDDTRYRRVCRDVRRFARRSTSLSCILQCMAVADPVVATPVLICARGTIVHWMSLDSRGAGAGAGASALGAEFGQHRRVHGLPPQPTTGHRNPSTASVVPLIRHGHLGLFQISFCPSHSRFLLFSPEMMR
jgi:hypothetical protein